MSARVFLSILALIPAVALAGVHRDLQMLYPDQSAQVLELRISNIHSKDDFFRSFIPYFYLRVRENFKNVRDWNDLINEQAWCAGDPHPANFGVLWTPNQSSIFTINDVDDANPCPIFVDVFRFLTGWSLVERDLSMSQLLNAYFSGLQSARNPGIPLPLQQMLAKSQQLGPLASKKWLDPKGKFKDSPELIDVKPTLGAEIRAQASNLGNNQWDVIDLKERLRFEGGSGGLKRFLVLMKRNSLVPPQFLLLEMKEISRPGTFPLNVPRLDPRSRILQALQWEQRPALTAWNQGVTLVGRPFHTRLLMDGNLGLKLDSFNKSDRAAIALHEAALLGRLHRTGGASANYLKKVTAVPPEAWEKAVKVLRDDIDDAWKKIRD